MSVLIIDVKEPLSQKELQDAMDDKIVTVSGRCLAMLSNQKIVNEMLRKSNLCDEIFAVMRSENLDDDPREILSEIDYLIEESEKSKESKCS